MARRTHPMEAGERDRAVRIEQMTESVGAAGSPVRTWRTLHDPYWCSKMDIGGRERFQSDIESSPYTTRWEGPYTSDLDPDTVDVTKLRRLVYQDRVYDIVSASMIGLRDGVELLTLASTRSV